MQHYLRLKTDTHTTLNSNTDNLRLTVFSTNKNMNNQSKIRSDQSKIGIPRQKLKQSEAQ